jgi:predicted TIM-barrel fold metal-dependent hydrolase
MQDKQFIPAADCHMHLSSQEISDQMLAKIPPQMIPGDLELKKRSAQDMIAVLDQVGIKKAFALSAAYVWGMDIIQAGPSEYDKVRFENDYSAGEAAKFPNRLTPFFSFNPLKDYAIEEMERCIDQLNMRGLKLHLTNSNVNLREPEHLERVRDVLTHAAQRNIPALFHFRSRVRDFGPRDAQIFVDQILMKIPKLKVQIAHLGSWGGYDDLTAEVFDTFIQAYEEERGLQKINFYIDISVVLLEKEVSGMQPATPEQSSNLAHQLRRWGIDHVLWGSDWPATESGESLQLILEKLPLSNEEFQTIFSKDGHELFAD